MRKIIFLAAMVGCVIMAACNPGDTRDPSTPTDLHFVCDAATGASVCDIPNTRVLTWIAGGDDGKHGNATQYDIRWSEKLMTDKVFKGSHQLVKESKPKKSGTHEVIFLPRLVPGQQISFGLMALDEVGHKSGIVTTPLVTLNFLEVPLHSGVTQAEYGSVAALVGDVDKNKKRDAAVGAPGAQSPLNGKDAGSVSLFLSVNKENAIVKDLEIPRAADSIFPEIVIYGAESGDRFGAAISGEADFNGDKINDFVVGAPGAGGGAGKVYVFFGGSAGRLNLKDLPENPATPVEVAAEDVADVIITGPAASSFGASVALVGNVNKQKGDELVVGAPDLGSAYIFYGGLQVGNAITGMTFPIIKDFSVADWTLQGPSGSNFGYSLNRVTSLDDDSEDEIAVGAPNLESVFVFYGGTRIGKAIDFLTIGPHLWTYNGSNFDLLLQGPAKSEFGTALGGHGHILGENKGSVVIGAPGEDAVYVIHGGTNGVIGFPTTGPTLHDVGTQGADMIMQGDVGSRFGQSLSVRSDLDGEGRADILVGAPLALDASVLEVGAVYAFYSKSDTPPSMSVADADAVIWGKTDKGEFGFSVTGIGDLISQSGLVRRAYADLIVGAPGAGDAFLEF